MDTTATLNLQPVTKSEQAHIVRHNSRENQTYENQDIDITKSHLNVYKQYHDEQELLNDQYKNYIDARNAKLERDFNAGKISLEQYTSRKQTVKEYLNGSNGSKQKKAYTDIVATVANAELLDDFKKVIPDDKWQEYFASVYDRTARRIDRLAGFSVANLHVHYDEGGMPHGHIEAVNNGITAAGKPSTTLNSALKLSYGNNDSRQNLRQLRDELDSGMIDDCNAVAQDMGIDLQLTLVRLGTVGGKTMQEYKAMKRREDALERRAKRLTGVVDVLAKKDKEVTQREHRVSDAEDKNILTNLELSGKKRKLDTREQAMQQRETKLDTREQDLTEAANKFNNKIIDFRTDLLIATFPKANVNRLHTWAKKDAIPFQDGHNEKVIPYVFDKLNTYLDKAIDRAKPIIHAFKKHRDTVDYVQDAVDALTNSVQAHSRSSYSGGRQKHNDDELER